MMAIDLYTDKQARKGSHIGRLSDDQIEEMTTVLTSLRTKWGAFLDPYEDSKLIPEQIKLVLAKLKESGHDNKATIAVLQAALVHDVVYAFGD